MSSKVQIRRARPSDLRHLAAVEDAGFAMYAEFFGDAVVPALSAPAPRGGDRDESGVVHVAVVDEVVVGFAHVVTYDLHAHLEQVSVLPAYGRRGIGASLVRAAMEEARWSGSERMSLCTYRDVPWNGPFYRGLGFAEVERLEPFQARLREREAVLRLDEPGPRVVMDAPLERSNTL